MTDPDELRRLAAAAPKHWVPAILAGAEQRAAIRNFYDAARTAIPELLDALKAAGNEVVDRYAEILRLRKLVKAAYLEAAKLYDACASEDVLEELWWTSMSEIELGASNDVHT
jgi:hypothetical protein